MLQLQQSLFLGFGSLSICQLYTPSIHTVHSQQSNRNPLNPLKAFARFQPLWRALEEVDGSCRTLDPPPSRAAAMQQLAEWAADAGTRTGSAGGGGWYARCSRRLPLPKGAGCLELAFAPAAPRALPSATFSGGGAAAAELQRRWFAAAPTEWSEARGVVANLEAVLGAGELQPPGRQQLLGLEQLRRKLPGLGEGDRAAASVVVAAGGADEEGAGPMGGVEIGSRRLGEGSEADASSSDNDDEDCGACGICYALLLRDGAAGCHEGGGCGLGDQPLTVRRGVGWTLPHLTADKQTPRHTKPINQPRRGRAGRQLRRGRGVRPPLPRVLPGRVAARPAQQPAVLRDPLWAVPLLLGADRCKDVMMLSLRSFES